MVTPLIGNHEGVSCDGCSVTAFVGNRYKCLRCGDYDLCFSCFTQKNYGDQTGIADVPPHDETHPMQLILSAVDYESVYEGDANRRYDVQKIVSFTCPYCNITGLTERQFGNHVTTVHPDPPGFSVICPLCIGNADAAETNITRETDNLSTHWQWNHGGRGDGQNDGDGGDGDEIDIGHGVLSFQSLWANFHRTIPDTVVVERMDPPTASQPMANAATRPAQRRPMLARRNPRPRGDAAATRMTGMVGRGVLADDELTEFMRTIRGEAPGTGTTNADEIRRMTEMLATPSAVTMARHAQRMLAAASADRERQAVVMESTLQMATESQFQQIVRPGQLIPIYPPTSDDSGDETTTTPQPAADSADEDDDDGDEEEQEEEEEEVISENGREIIQIFEKAIAEDEELKNDEFWQTLKTRLSPDDVALLLETMKTTAKVSKEDGNSNSNGKEEQERMMHVWTSSGGGRPMMKPIANASAQVTTTSDAEGDQGWLPLTFETTPTRSTGCGGYWSDKRYLRPRKMQREQSVASSNAEIMEKADVAMALCRASCAHEPTFSDITKPDISLKEALRHLSLGQAPERMMEYQAAAELMREPERDPFTAGDEPIEIPDFTAGGYSHIVDGSGGAGAAAVLGVLPEEEGVVAEEAEPSRVSRFVLERLLLNSPPPGVSEREWSESIRATDEEIMAHVLEQANIPLVENPESSADDVSDEEEEDDDDDEDDDEDADSQDESIPEINIT